MRQTYKTHVVLGLVTLMALTTATLPQTQDLVSAFALAVADVMPFLLALVAVHWVLLRSTGASSVRSMRWVHVGTILLSALIVELSDVLLWWHGISVDRFLGAEQVSGVALLREYGEAVFFGSLLWGSSLATTRWLAHAASPSGLVTLPKEDQAATGFLQEIRKSGISEPVEYLKAEGNYVNVTGATSHKLLAYRFARAVEELGLIGIQVHRSYWVARDAVSHVTKAGKNTVIIVKSGRAIPVSNRYLLAVRSLASPSPEQAANPGHCASDPRP
ncbi:MAG: LytTR family DNA-binding domain-containing protein [Betaproteobacteria bacterium]